jgi:hypothetical protein
MSSGAWGKPGQCSKTSISQQREGEREREREKEREGERERENSFHSGHDHFFQFLAKNLIHESASFSYVSGFCIFEPKTLLE